MIYKLLSVSVFSEDGTDGFLLNLTDKNNFYFTSVNNDRERMFLPSCDTCLEGVLFRLPDL